MPNKRFVDSCNECFTNVLNHLHATAKDFGPTDFPEDSGKAFRNHLAGYPLSAIQTMYHLLDKKPDDAWAIRNSQRVTSWDSRTLMPLLGTLHYFADCRRLNIDFHRLSPSERSLGNDAGTRTTLDWIVNSYALDPTSATNWFKAVIKHDEPVEFQHAARSLLSESLTPLFAEPLDSNNDSWPGLALLADLTRPSFEDASWDAQCRDLFGD